MEVTVKVDSEALELRLKGLGDVARDMRPAFRRFAQYMRVQTDNTFEAMRTGGQHRGVHWPYFAPQYTRKDGTVVPAWGGVPYANGNGTVKGRKRPSGRRIRRGDALMQDTMTMRARAALVQHMGRNVARLGPQGVKYAAVQQARRPFLFFTKQDGAILGEMLRDYLTRNNRR